MRDMEVLNLYHLQGEVKFMLEGLTAMPRLRTLKISMCRLAGPAFLDDILIAVGHSLRSLTVRWCGSACEVAEAVAAALPCMPALKHLGMTFQGPMEPSAVILLATAIASCHDLHTLDIQLTQGYFSAGPFGVTVPIPVWQQVTALKNLTSLTVAAALGWREDALAAVCASSTGLTQVRLCDGRRCITNDWVGHIGRLPRLMDLKLEWCQELEVGVLDALSLATALTQLRTFRCTGVDDADAVHALRAALPTLVMCNMH